MSLIHGTSPLSGHPVQSRRRTRDFVLVMSRHFLSRMRRHHTNTSLHCRRVFARADFQGVSPLLGRMRSGGPEHLARMREKSSRAAQAESYGLFSDLFSTSIDTDQDGRTTGSGNTGILFSAGVATVDATEDRRAIAARSSAMGA